MKYDNTCLATFVSRPNRFIAQVVLDEPESEAEGSVQAAEPALAAEPAFDAGPAFAAGADRRPITVHVKNTGRCRELLVPGCKVVMAKSDNPNRKTAYDLVGVYKHGDWLFNIDSQAPNAVVAEWLSEQGFSLIKPEYTFGNSRFDFYMERIVQTAGGKQQFHPAMKPADSYAGFDLSPDPDFGRDPDPNPARVERYLLEVKGCTLEVDGVGYFPDAPTERGIKHLNELASASEEGFRCAVAFVIGMEGVNRVLPNMETHPAFGDALAHAEACGVRVLNLRCDVSQDEFRVSAGQSFF